MGPVLLRTFEQVGQSLVIYLSLLAASGMDCEEGTRTQHLPLAAAAVGAAVPALRGGLVSLPIVLGLALGLLVLALAFALEQFGEGVHGVVDKVLAALLVGGFDGGGRVGGGGASGRLVAVEARHVAGEVVHGLEDGVAPAAHDVALLVEQRLLLAAATAAPVEVTRGRRFPRLLALQ